MTIETIQQELGQVQAQIQSVKDQLASMTRPSKLKGIKLPIRYRDGENTWTGRGKTPRWLAAKIAAGATREQFEVSE